MGFHAPCRERNMLRPRKMIRCVLPLVLALGLATAGGCAAPYLFHVAQGQAAILMASRPIEEVINAPSVEPDVRAKLKLVQAVKRFGEEAIGLKADSSFTTFTPVDGPAALYIVTAAPKLELKAHTWTFPLVGSFPYKGFFDKALAEAEQEHLARAGLDTNLRAVAAYSTLGWFTDPVLEPLLASGEVTIASVILHEKTHATVFVPNYVAFNEGLATFVGRRGAVAFFAATEGRGSPHHTEAVRRVEDERRFGGFLLEVTAELEQLYGSDLPRAEKLTRREAIFERSRLRILEERDRYHYPDLVEFYSKARINNAFLVTLQLYSVDVETYEKVHERHGRDLAKTVAFFKAAGRVAGDPEVYVRRWLEAGGPRVRPRRTAGPTR